MASEAKEDQRQEIAEIRRRRQKWWVAQAESSRLHYIFGGLVSAGKTTLLNSVLANGLHNYPEGLQLLDSDLLENTSAISILELDPQAPDVFLYQESMKVTPDGPSVTTKAVRSLEMHCPTIHDLHKKLPSIMRELNATKGVIQRLCVRLPYKFWPIPQGAAGQMAGEFLCQLKDGHSSKRDRIGNGIAGTAPILVDTPGLDSPMVKQQLLSILEQKAFVFCFLVDMMKPNPFGNQGFEILKFLNERLTLPFPPVIVFTKWEKFKRQWEGKEGKRFMKQEAKGQTPEQVATRLLEMVFTKLKLAKINSTPYFAAVNAVDSLERIQDADDEEERRSIENSKLDMCLFMQRLHQLGSKVATPLRNHRLLCGWMEGVQDVVNAVLRDSESAKVLKSKHVTEMDGMGKHIKSKYKKDVVRYFNNITWTPEGVTEFRPMPPFNKENCAINMIVPICKDVFEQYKFANKDMGNQKQAVQEIVGCAIREIQYKILQNMALFEEEAMREYEQVLQRIVGQSSHTEIGDIKISIFERILGSSIVLTGVTAGTTVGVHVTGVLTGAWAGLGIGLASGLLSGGAIILMGSAFLAKNYIGMWTWEQCEARAIDEVLANLEKGHPHLAKSIIAAFHKRVDDTFKRMRDFRMPDGGRADTRTAAEAMEKCREQKLKMEQKVQQVLFEGKEHRWLAGDASLQRVWLPVFNKYYGTAAQRGS